jgi:hypothetical protein
MRPRWTKVGLTDSLSHNDDYNGDYECNPADAGDNGDNSDGKNVE